MRAVCEKAALVCDDATPVGELGSREVAGEAAFRCSLALQFDRDAASPLAAAQ